MFIVKLFYWLLMIAIWVWIIKYRKQVKSWTGNWVWAERYIWRGWTYFVMLLLWLALIFLGVLYPFGLLDRGGISWNVNDRNEEILSE